jgi:hypothetical protein
MLHIELVTKQCHFYFYMSLKPSPYLFFHNLLPSLPLPMLLPLRICMFQPGLVLQVYNPSTGEAEAGGWLVCGLSNYIVTPCLNTLPQKNKHVTVLEQAMALFP